MRKIWKTPRLLLLVAMMALAMSLRAQDNSDSSVSLADAKVDALAREELQLDYSGVKGYFEEAYRLYPSVPQGVLEAVAFTYTRFHCPSPSDVQDSGARDMPPLHGVMGLTLNGKGVFRENLKLISRLSGVPVADICTDGRAAVLAYAAAFSLLQDKYGCRSDSLCDVFPVLVELSELPLGDATVQELFAIGVPRWDLNRHPELFPMMSSLYAICLFLADTAGSVLGSPGLNVDFRVLFGENLRWLVSPAVKLGRAPRKGVGECSSADYPGAVWMPAASCNYTVGRTLTVSNVTIHYTQGTYAGSIAWFQNCNARASAHYVIRSIDGQVTQMVAEADKAWHVGSENGYTVGIEHEAYGDIRNFFTTAMYHSSATLVRDICARRPNISPLRTFFRDTLDNGTALNTGVHSLGNAASCTQIRGHQHYPNQSHTDPGPFWDWNYYYKLLNPIASVELYADTSGVFCDSGGPCADYGDDERRIVLVQVSGADSVELDFTTFDLEADYDFMWIYEGTTPFAPLIGRWNTVSPGRVVARGDRKSVV